MRIYHPHSNTWLVAEKGNHLYLIKLYSQITASVFAGKHYTRKVCNSNETGLASLEWDSAELFQIGVQDQMSYDDAFTIEEV